MSPFFSNKRLIVLLVSLIILVALIGYSMKDREETFWPEQFLKDTVGWFQSVLYKPAHLAAGFFENIEDIQNVYKQNQELKSHLSKLGEVSQEVARLRQRNEELQSILHKLDEPDLADYSVIQSHVIARSPDGWNEQVTINKGSQDGVKLNNAVITAKGMIGKIDSVNPFSSTVQLISDLDRTNLISAVIQGNHDVYGMIAGYDPEKEALLFKLIPYDKKLKKGQTVVTSGLGGVFPAGLIIGKVKSVSPDPQGLTKVAFVDPSADLYDIYNVMVVDRGAQSPETTKDKDDKEASSKGEEQ
ncbi:MAG TPA: rod shape-determining protein MreC [Bacillales bacterium]|nr:rod shape-determining protein MreC [Bacillales bacterium]